MLYSFHSRITVTFAGLMLLTGGVNIVLAWTALNNYKQSMMGTVKKDMSALMPETCIILINKIITQTSLSVLFAMITGLVILAFLMRRFDELVKTIAIFEDAQLPDKTRSNHARAFAGDEIARLDGLFHRMSALIDIQSRYILEQDELRREMVANVSHDLRTPMTSMQGYLETLLRKSGQLSTMEQRRYLEVAVRQSQRVSDLAQNLFELARLEAQDARPYFEGFFIQELIQDLLQKFSKKAIEQNIQIVTEFLPDTPIVSADIGMIERLVTNLVDTSICHTPKFGIIRLTVSYEDNQLKITIRSPGAGMADTYLLGLFGSNALLRNNLGHNRIGLGLLMAKRIIQLHQSVIQISCGKECGLSFAFRLPVQC